MNAWFDDFENLCAEIASRHRAPIDAPHLNAAVARELLELTRVVARGSERQFAPLAAFVVGEAIERMTRSNPALENEEIVRFVQDLKQALPQSEPSA